MRTFSTFPGCSPSGGEIMRQIGHFRFPRRLSIDRPCGTVVVGMTLLGFTVNVGADAKSGIGILVENIPLLGGIGPEVRVEKSIVAKGALQVLAHHFTAAGTIVRLQGLAAVPPQNRRGNTP